MERVWTCWAGPERTVVLDQGGEFAREFADDLEGHGTQIRWTSVQAPWKNGTCERHGGAWKAMATHSIYENKINDLKELQALSVLCNWQKNSRVNETGYSPAQWVLGRNPDVPSTGQDSRQAHTNTRNSARTSGA